MVNALCDDLLHNPGQVSEFLSWFDFTGVEPTPSFTGIQSVTLLVEQTFSYFGDLDLLILLEFEAEKFQALLVEAKVSNDTNSWLTIEDRWEEFLAILDGGQDNTSNLFVQLHRKVRLVEFLQHDGKDFALDLLVAQGNLGKNQVVTRAAAMLRKYIREGNALYAAIVPDELDALLSFARDTLRSRSRQEMLPTWNPSQWGFLSWHTIAEKAKGDSWLRTVKTLQWNEGQIFRTSAPVQHLVQEGQVYSLNGQPVYVVDRGRGHECRVAELNTVDDRFFWKTKRVGVHVLQPCEVSVSVTPVPSLPRTDAAYIWDCLADTPRLPPQPGSVEIECGIRLIIVGRPSWLTTRVRKENSHEGTDFLVYTHHLQRQSVAP